MNITLKLTSVILTAGILSGCALLPYLDKIKIEPSVPEQIPEQIPGPEPEPEPEPEARTVVAVHLPYNSPWNLTLTGRFPVDRGIRIAQDAKGLRRGIDLFVRSGHICLRLYDKAIIFLEADIGSISMPAPPNHWLISTKVRHITSGTHSLRIEYRDQGAVRMLWDSELIASGLFAPRPDLPVRTELALWGFVGDVKITK